MFIFASTYLHTVIQMDENGMLKRELMKLQIKQGLKVIRNSSKYKKCIVCYHGNIFQPNTAESPQKDQFQ